MQYNNKNKFNNIIEINHVIIKLNINNMIQIHSIIINLYINNVIEICNIIIKINLIISWKYFI